MKNITKENYPSWLVPLEIVKSLKEIGFKGGVLSEDLTLVTKKQLSGDLGYCAFNLDDFEEGEVPTWEQVFEWFREKGLVGVIVTNEILNEGDPLYFPIVDDLDGDYYTLDNYYTYEEAREALVNKLIELYKNQINKI